MPREYPRMFDCRGDALIGIRHDGAEGAATGVLIVVGGPQFRVGSHRQFVLLARALAAAGIPAMRFDYRGMGDAGGEPRGFLDNGDDIRAAIDAFVDDQPGLERIVIWGLCDGAAAALLYGHADPRVSAIVALNPWVRTKAGHARAQIKHYYLHRLTERTFWRKALFGELDLGDSSSSLLATLRRLLPRISGRDRANSAPSDQSDVLAERMAEGLAAFRGPLLLIISGNDLTAREFEDAASASKLWPRLLGEKRVTRRDLAAADHTFSRREWRDQVAAWTIDWIEHLPIGPSARERPVIAQARARAREHEIA